MPGTESDYSLQELREMDREEFEAAQARGFRKPVTEADVAAAYVTGRPAAAGVAVVKPASDVWSKRKKRTIGEDFVCPSGQKCRMRVLEPEELLEKGILDRVTRLDGLADNLVQVAEGAPPQKTTMPTPDEFRVLLDTINIVVTLAVAEPRVYQDDDDNAPDDAIRVSDVALDDRLAILNHALSGLKKLDNFRNPG